MDEESVRNLRAGPLTQPAERQAASQRFYNAGTASFDDIYHQAGLSEVCEGPEDSGSSSPGKASGSTRKARDAGYPYTGRDLSTRKDKKTWYADKDRNVFNPRVLVSKRKQEGSEQLQMDRGGSDIGLVPRSGMSLSPIGDQDLVEDEITHDRTNQNPTYLQNRRCLAKRSRDASSTRDSSETLVHPPKVAKRVSFAELPDSPLTEKQSRKFRRRMEECMDFLRKRAEKRRVLQMTEAWCLGTVETVLGWEPGKRVGSDGEGSRGKNSWSDDDCLPST